MLLLRLPRCQSLRHSIDTFSYYLTKPVVPKKFVTTARTVTALDMETINTTERLKRLRDLMKENKVDIYSMHHLWLPISHITHPTIIAKLYHPRIVINPNILPLVMSAEVWPTPLVLSSQCVKLTSFRIHLWFLWVCRHSCGHLGKSRFGNGWTIFQSSFKTARQ